MAIKNFVALAALLNFGLIQAELIHGTNIPNLDLSQTVGDWYVIKGPGVNDDIACITLSITPQSPHNVSITTNISMIPGEIMSARDIRNIPVIAPFSCSNRIDSNIISCKNNYRLGVSLVVFDVVYDSYMAVYLIHEDDDMNSDNTGLIFILGRYSTLSSEIIDAVKQSNFYLQSINPEHQLTSSHASGC